MLNAHNGDAQGSYPLVPFYETLFYKGARDIQSLTVEGGAIIGFNQLRNAKNAGSCELYQVRYRDKYRGIVGDGPASRFVLMIFSVCLTFTNA